MSGVAGTHMFKHTRATIVVSQTTNVFHFAGIRPIDMHPGVLYGVVSFGERAEHSTGHSPQARPMLLEPVCQARHALLVFVPLGRMMR